jgi:hypothetical protein
LVGSCLFRVNYVKNGIGHVEEVLVEHGSLQLGDSFFAVIDLD